MLLLCLCFCSSQVSTMYIQRQEVLYYIHFVLSLFFFSPNPLFCLLYRNSYKAYISLNIGAVQSVISAVFSDWCKFIYQSFSFFNKQLFICPQLCMLLLHVLAILSVNGKLGLKKKKNLDYTFSRLSVRLPHLQYNLLRIPFPTRM